MLSDLSFYPFCMPSDDQVLKNCYLVNTKCTSDVWFDFWFYYYDFFFNYTVWFIQWQKEIFLTITH